MAGVTEADQKDIEASLDGDEDAYARLVRRHQPGIAGALWRFSRDRQTHEELLQDVFVEAYLSLAGFKGTGPFDHWLRKIAVRVGYRHWKRLARERQRPTVSLHDVELSGGSPVGEMDAALAAERLHGLLSQLPPRDHLVLNLLYLEGCSVQEAAELTGWSKTMVKVQAHRARKKLRRLLDEKDWR